MTANNSSNVYLSWVGTYETPFWFDANNVGNYIGKVNGYPAVVGNNSAYLVGGINSVLVTNTGMTVSINGANSFVASSTGLTIANSTVSTTIPIPTSGQHASASYFLNANGSWTIPPNPVNNTTGFSGSQQFYYYDGVSSFYVYATLYFANGLCTGIVTS